MSTAKDRVSVVVLKCQNNNSYVVVQNDSTLTLYQTMEQNGVFKPVLIHNFPEFKAITGHIHSGASSDINDHIFLFDDTNMYVIKTNPDTCSAYPDVYCVGIQNFSKSVNYALCQGESKYPGLRLFNMETILKKNKC